MNATTNDRPATRGFGPLVCLKCGQEATIRLDLDDVAHFTCGECDESWDIAAVKAHLDSWCRVLRWLETARVRS
jgi:hypothetical protein